MRETRPATVRGSRQRSTILGLPSLVTCSVAAMSRFAPVARSMPPPIPGVRFPGTR